MSPLELLPTSFMHLTSLHSLNPPFGEVISTAVSLIGKEEGQNYYFPTHIFFKQNFILKLRLSQFGKFG